jgi:hypothetical protein
LGLLHISLVEELVEQKISPLGADLVRSERSTDVTGMKGHAGDELLGDLNSFRRRSVNKQVSVLTVLDGELVQVVLEFISQLLHGGHVGEQDRLNDSFFNQFDLGSCKFTAKEIVFRNVQELNSLSCMEVLLDVLLTVHLADGGLGYDMVPVVEAIMLHIVAEGCDNERQIVQIVELGIFHEILGLQNKPDMLGHVRSMKIIVVLNRSSVFVVDLGNELEELVMINSLEQVVVFEQ